MYSRGIKSYRVSFDFYITPAIKLLLIANFAVFIFEALLYRFSGVSAYAELVKWFGLVPADRKSTRLNSSHGYISYAVFCLKKKNTMSFCLSCIRLRTHCRHLHYT